MQSSFSQTIVPDGSLPLVQDFQSPLLSRETAVLSHVDPNESFDLNSVKLPGFNHRYRYSEQKGSPMIDNTNVTYLPLILQCGVTACCRPDVLVRCPLILQDLNRDILACLAILPVSTHALIKRTRLWLNTTYYYGPKACPKNVNHSTTHHHEGWLLWARDRPEKARGIEIYNVFDYRSMRLHWNGCGLILHEYSHLIHQLCLGLECQEVKDAYVRAKNSGLYDHTPRRDWAGNEVETDMAYAMVNHKEFFAEMSVSFLADAYEELNEFCRDRLNECSPPLLAPHVVERVCARTRYYPVSTEFSIQRSWTTTTTESWFRFLARKSSKPPSMHCNKFYPFTNGQLRHLDPILYATMEHLWVEIAHWVDDDDDNPCRKWGIVCLPC